MNDIKGENRSGRTHNKEFIETNSRQIMKGEEFGRTADTEVRRIMSLKTDRPTEEQRKNRFQNRLRRIEFQDPDGLIPGYDANMARLVEDKKIKSNPTVFIRRHRGQMLDRGTELELKKSLEAREKLKAKRNLLDVLRRKK